MGTTLRNKTYSRFIAFDIFILLHFEMHLVSRLIQQFPE
jgi:hypothetical protein